MDVLRPPGALRAGVAAGSAIAEVIGTETLLMGPEAPTALVAIKFAGVEEGLFA